MADRVPAGALPPSETQVGIVGAGPAGLVLGLLLARAGIDAVVLEHQDRSYVESRIRAGVLEDPTVRLLERLGVADRLRHEGLVHRGVNLQFEGRRHRIDFEQLTGRAITVYGQQEVVKDLIAARLAAGDPLYFEATVEAIEGIGGTGEPDAAGSGNASGGGQRPVVVYRHGGRRHRLVCDFVAGCDGFHGVSRATLPAGAIRTYEKEYPYGWLGILAAVAPSTDELIYAYHQRGFAMHSLRSPTLSRLYLQVDPADTLDAWPDERIWAELQVRLASPGWTLTEGPVLDKSITPMRSFVTDPMAHGRLFLAGDAAHIVPPTGAKGLNLAVADVTVLAAGLKAWYQRGERDGLDDYSRRCLRRVWRVQDFSTTMTALLHVDPAGSGFDAGLQRARQEYLVSSTAMARSLAENYVGLPFDDCP